MIRRGSILQHMNEHTVPSEIGGYLFEFRGKRPLRETARWITGLGLFIGGVAIAVIGNASSSYLSIPLGIAVAVLGVTLLIAYAFSRNKTNLESAPVRAGKRRVQRVSKVSAKGSLASELALLADLYSQGALSPGEFEAAKRRILDI
jgi:uncharacterized membrane protein YfcA